MPIQTILLELPTWAGDIITLLGLVTAADIAVANTASFLAKFYPPAVKVTDGCTRLATWLHEAAGVVAQFLPATAEKRAMRRAREAMKRAAARGSDMADTLAILVVGTAFVLGTHTAACTPAQAASDVAQALSDTEKACVIVEVLGPMAGVSASNVTAIEQACDIAQGSEALVEKVIQDLAAAKAKLAAKRERP